MSSASHIRPVRRAHRSPRQGVLSLGVALLCGGLFLVLMAAPSFGQEEESVEEELNAASCQECHDDRELTTERQGREISLSINGAAFAASAHGEMDCTSCHEDIEELPHEERLARIDCGSCHDEEQERYDASIHATRAGEPERAGPSCESCHGPIHEMLPRSDPRSPLAAATLPRTCGVCHGETAMPPQHTLEIPKTFQEYAASIHGRQLMQGGALYAATCKDCHANHLVVKPDDSRSPIHRSKVIDTCGRCHAGVRTQFLGSIHGVKFLQGNAKVPVCTQCHKGHRIIEPETDEFQLKTIAECGTCHNSLLAAYRRTYHGKVTELGYAGVAACSSCHTAHNIRLSTDDASSIAQANIVATCRQCHPAANAKFASFVVHPDYTDRKQSPLLYWVYHVMLTILFGTLAVFGLHTVLWYHRAWRERRGHRKAATDDGEAYLRLSSFNRLLHMLVMTSFILLVITGIPLAFSHTQWAAAVFRFLGGYRIAALLHRFGAIVTFLYVMMHVAFIAYLVIVKRQRDLLWGPRSMVARPKDVRDVFAHLKWFLGRGPRPRFDRWTYWEKFDYYADFWGVLVFGSTGLVLWFPTYFTRFLPGVAINVSLVMHGIEALLAISFIFTIHFFNAHLRPGKFPMDPVIMTGRISRRELEEERPAEYERYVREGALERFRTTPAPAWLLGYARIVGFVALAFGLCLIALIVVSLLLR